LLLSSTVIHLNHSFSCHPLLKFNPYLGSILLYFAHFSFNYQSTVFTLVNFELVSLYFCFSGASEVYKSRENENVRSRNLNHNKSHKNCPKCFRGLPTYISFYCIASSLNPFTLTRKSGRHFKCFLKREKGLDDKKTKSQLNWNFH